jgi:hypothetical protein
MGRKPGRSAVNCKLHLLGGVPPMRSCVANEGTIMPKLVGTGMAVYAVPALWAGNANAHVHKSPVHKSYVQATALTLSSSSVKGGPLHDCVHVIFPQCGDGG